MPRLRRVNRLCSSTVSENCELVEKWTRNARPYNKDAPTVVLLFAAVSSLPSPPCPLREKGRFTRGWKTAGCLPFCAPAARSGTPPPSLGAHFHSKVKTPFRTEQGFVLRFICVQELALRDSAYRAGTCAGTAIYTCVSVDLVLAVALSDSANRALASARAAHNAAATDNICHWYCTSKCILQLSFYHKI